MSVDIDVKVDIADAVKRLQAIDRRSENVRPTLLWARTELEEAYADNFATNGLPVGGWSPLDPKYAAWKAGTFPGRPTMVRSGALFQSLTTLRGAPNVVGNMEATFGTSVRYARFHQDGTFRMPKRRVLFEPPTFAKRLAMKVGDWVANGVM